VVSNPKPPPIAAIYGFDTFPAVGAMFGMSARAAPQFAQIAQQRPVQDEDRSDDV
jgi:hypothetical protein